jgi:choloylglycine hydrolase
MTLASLEQVDDYPLYVMHYYGAYTQTRASADEKLLTARRGLDLAIQAERMGMFARRGLSNPRAVRTQAASLDWACSLFAAFGDGAVYGRNFDWEFSPALLLFTDPPDGYASVSMFDLAYLHLSSADARALTELSLEDRRPLLQTPFLPFDGMNEHGLAVAMAAVSGSPMPYDPAKPTIGSIGIIRAMLDHARDVDEALALFQQYNIDMEGGPPIHYLIADATGQAVLVEFYDGETVVMPNEAPWHLATNFYRASAPDSPQGKCRRYDTIQAHLAETNGQLTSQDAMALLADVAQPGTQWSVVYDMTTGTVDVVMGYNYDVVYTFQLIMVEK